MKRVRVGFDEPEELFQDGPKEDSFCGKEREDRVAEGETELRRRENGESASTGSVGTGFAVGEDISDEVEVLVLLVLGKFTFGCRRRISMAHGGKLLS